MCNTCRSQHSRFELDAPALLTSRSIQRATRVPLLLNIQDVCCQGWGLTKLWAFAWCSRIQSARVTPDHLAALPIISAHDHWHRLVQASNGFVHPLWSDSQSCFSSIGGR